MLSDAVIQRMMSQGSLVLGGDPAFATQAAYHFRPGKIFCAGDDGKVIDWVSAAPPSNAAFVIQPGAIIWVRMKEEVSLPNNICATWWQTHTLSKQGIMLVNMSVVDPGYRGNLACLFVNFGKSHVRIDPNTTMAKLVFFDVVGGVSSPYSKHVTSQEYDADLHSSAINAPKTFLRVSELSAELNVEKTRILDEIAQDAPKRMKGALAWAFLGFSVLVLALSFVPWLQKAISPNIDQSIEDVVDKRLVERLTSGSSELDRRHEQEFQNLEMQLSELKAEVDKQKVIRKAGPGAGQH